MGDSRGRSIPGRQFLAGDSWRGRFLAQLRKGKGKRKQSDGLIVMYFFDWVVGVIRYGSPALSDSEDRVIGRAILGDRQFLVGNSFCGVVFLCCAALQFDSWRAICERESINGDVRILFFASPPLLPALLPAPLSPPPPPAHAHCRPLRTRPLPARAQRQRSMFLRLGAGQQYVNKNHFDLILGVGTWGALSLSNYVRFVCYVLSQGSSHIEVLIPTVIKELSH
jgi:hypothetical protein